MMEWIKSSYSTGGACVQKGTWIKSSYSADGADCVQKGTWIKSSYSADTANCVEMGECLCHGVPIRDSKDPDGPILLFSKESWADFIGAIKDGQFD